jgi:hypothetical protein
MTLSCSACDALYFPNEKNTRSVYSRCCKNGAKKADPFPEPTVLIKQLLGFEHVKSRHFLDNMVYYCNSMAMASVGIKTYDFAAPGPPVLPINGIFMHRTSK